MPQREHTTYRTERDARVRIPMSGAMDTTLDSLNVNVAAAIVLERVFTLNRSPDAAED